MFTSEEIKNDQTESMLVPEDEFALTKLIRAVNGKLKDGIAGVIQRAYNVFKVFIIFIKDMIVHLIVDGIPWLCRSVWNILTFIFGRKMRNLVKENIILVVLFPAFLGSILWPFAMCYFGREKFWLWIGWDWLVFIGLVGAWIGFKKNSIPNGSKSSKRGGRTRMLSAQLRRRRRRKQGPWRLIKMKGRTDYGTWFNHKFAASGTCIFRCAK